MVKRYVIGDIHGQYYPLKHLLKLVDFDYEADKLIVLGDICDGGKDTKLVIDELLKIKHLVLCLGNHDVWLKDFIDKGQMEEIWIQQGGAATLESYGAKVIKLGESWDDKSEIDLSGLEIPIEHLKFLQYGTNYHFEDNMLFVHGGFDPEVPITKQSQQTLMWDRTLIEFAKDKTIKRNLETVCKKVDWKKVFVGHTTTEIFGSVIPLKFNNLIMMDTGAGMTGTLSIMNIDTGKSESTLKMKQFYNKLEKQKEAGKNFSEKGKAYQFDRLTRKKLNKDINRLVLVDETGRQYDEKDIEIEEFTQDSGKTLKVLIKKR